MSVYPVEYLEDEAYDSSTYTNGLQSDFDHTGLGVVGDPGYLSGTDKFPGFWDDALSAGSWSDAGIPDAMVDSGIGPLPEMIGGDFYQEQFLPPKSFSGTSTSPEVVIRHQKPRPHRSATAPSRPISSPERSPKMLNTKSHARHHLARYAQRNYGVSKPSASSADKAKTVSSPPSKPQSSRASSTSSNESNGNGVNGNGTTKYTRTHYVVEKRYRTNLNDKFEELRDCLVSARQYLSADYNPDGQLGREDQQKMSKTRVLAEAVEYIRHLEEQNDRVMDHIEMLERRFGLRDTEESMSDS